MNEIPTSSVARAHAAHRLDNFVKNLRYLVLPIDSAYPDELSPSQRARLERLLETTDVEVVARFIRAFAVWLVLLRAAAASQASGYHKLLQGDTTGLALRPSSDSIFPVLEPLLDFLVRLQNRRLSCKVASTLTFRDDGECRMIDGTTATPSSSLLLALRMYPNLRFFGMSQKKAAELMLKYPMEMDTLEPPHARPFAVLENSNSPGGAVIFFSPETLKHTFAVDEKQKTESHSIVASTSTSSKAMASKVEDDAWLQVNPKKRKQETVLLDDDDDDLLSSVIVKPSSSSSIKPPPAKRPKTEEQQPTDGVKEEKKPKEVASTATVTKPTSPPSLASTPPPPPPNINTNYFLDFTDKHIIPISPVTGALNFFRHARFNKFNEVPVEAIEAWNVEPSVFKIESLLKTLQKASGSKNWLPIAEFLIGVSYARKLEDGDQIIPQWKVGLTMSSQTTKVVVPAIIKHVRTLDREVRAKVFDEKVNMWRDPSVTQHYDSNTDYTDLNRKLANVMVTTPLLSLFLMLMFLPYAPPSSAALKNGKSKGK